jgi:hypothetical protein
LQDAIGDELAEVLKGQHAAVAEANFAAKFGE